MRTSPGTLQKHWELLENRKQPVMHGGHKHKTKYFASLDVETAFDVANPGILEEDRCAWMDHRGAGGNKGPAGEDQLRVVRHGDSEIRYVSRRRVWRRRRCG